MRSVVVFTLTLALVLAVAAPAAPVDESAVVTEVGFVPENVAVESINLSTDITGGSAAALSSRTTDQVLDRLVNITFNNADLENALRIMARQMDLNIIIGPGVRGKTITLDLRDVPLRYALDAVLAANDLGFVIERGGIVRVVDAAVIRPDTIERQILVRRLNWQVAQDLEPILIDFVSGGSGGGSGASVGELRSDPSTNAIIIQDVPSRVEELDALLDELDTPERQVMIQARLVDVTEDFLRRLSSNFGIGQLDDQPSTLDPAFGNAPFNPIFDGLTAIGAEGTFIAADAIGVGGGRLPDPAGVWTYGTNWLGYDVTAAIDVLEEEGLARVLASPRVATINNVPAEIEIIREEPYVESTFNPGGQTTQSVLFKDVGLTLTVTPRITNNGYVRMNILTEQEILVSSVRVVDSLVPVIARRSATTNIITPDKGTAIVGGLRQLEDINGEGGVPWFKDLPVVGWLFRGNDYGRDRIDYYVFVTPEIIQDPTLNATDRYAHDLLDLEWDLPRDYYMDDMRIETTY